MRRRLTITKERFAQLRRGDVVLWGQRKTPRVVQLGEPDTEHIQPRTCFNPSIMLGKLTRAGYDNPTTVYYWTDVCRIIRPTDLRVTAKRIARDYGRLESMGYDVRRAVANVKKRYAERLKCNESRKENTK